MVGINAALLRQPIQHGTGVEMLCQPSIGNVPPVQMLEITQAAERESHVAK